MKVKIMDNNNVETYIDAKSIDIGGINLLQFLSDYRKLKEEFRQFKGELEKREQELLKAWKKLH